MSISRLAGWLASYLLKKRAAPTCVPQQHKCKPVRQRQEWAGEF